MGSNLGYLLKSFLLYRNHDIKLKHQISVPFLMDSFDVFVGFLFAFQHLTVYTIMLVKAYLKLVHMV